MADETADRLRAAGIPVSDDEITAARAFMDQATAEANHLIEHGLAMVRGSDRQGIQESVLLRSHLTAHGTLPEPILALLTALSYRAGQLAHTVLTLNDEKTALAAELAAARAGQQ